MDLLDFVAGRLTQHSLDLLVMVGVMASFWIFEHLLPAELGQTTWGRVRNLRFVSLYHLGGGVLVSLLAYLVLPHVLLAETRVFDRSPLEQAGVILLYIFLGDLVFYWYHRAQHSMAGLWPIHELHHSDDELNATSSLRTYLLERPLQFILISVPITALIGNVPGLDAIRLTSEDTGRLYLVWLTWVVFAHANLRLQFGRWSWLATGPQVHRIHHSVEERHQRRNFAQFFPIIDVIFGTYCAPERDEFPRTGTPGASANIPFGRACIRPFRLWLTGEPR